MDIASDLSENTSDSDERIELLAMIKKAVIENMGEEYWDSEYEKILV